MKYSVSVVKRITLLIMTMALAVAMVACSAATSVKGEQGAQGAQGEQGPPGEPGTSDNEPPMAAKDLPMVYLALAGDGMVDKKTGIDLNKYFSDAEKAQLTFEAETSDKAIATAEAAAGKLDVTGKGAGTATITVKAYDGVNSEPAMSSFEVMVVAQNTMPVFTGSGTDGVLSDDELSALRLPIYKSLGGTLKATIEATIHAGEAGTFEDDIDFAYDMGAAGKDDDIVSVSITRKPGTTNMWEIELTPLNAGLQNVYVTVKDKFGITAENPTGNASGTADGDEPNTVQRFKFVAFVNNVPSLDMALPDRTIVVADTAGTIYTIAEFFVTGEVPPAAGPKIGKMTALAAAPTAATAPSPEADSANCTATASNTALTLAPATGNIATGLTVTSPTGPVGTYSVTITCRDAEDFATGTANVTVRAART